MKPTMEKPSHQELGDVDDALDKKGYVRKPLPKIPHKEWEAFEEFAELDCAGDWGMAFSRLVRDVIVEPVWLRAYTELSQRIADLEKVAVSTSPEEDKEEESDLGENCMGKKFKELINDD